MHDGVDVKWLVIFHCLHDVVELCVPIVEAEVAQVRKQEVVHVDPLEQGEFVRKMIIKGLAVDVCVVCNLTDRYLIERLVL